MNLSQAVHSLSDVVQVWEYERGLLYQKGQFVRQLEPGRYRLWRWRHQAIRKVSLRQTSQTISGQEILTRDKVPLRITLIAQYAVADPPLALHVVESYVEQLYQDLQLALRYLVADHTIDNLLAERDKLGEPLQESVAPLAEVYGIELHRVGVKDIILPGSVQNVFLREIEADRLGRAALVAARHETAATRAKANTAKLILDNPSLMRLQELDTLAKLASKPGNLLIVPGLENLLSRNGE
jgi:regulator of protease activity HflC (stomatin/prohibitin superfamily)